MNHDIGRNAVMPTAQSYNEWRRELETYIEHSKLEAVFNVNKAFLSLYWHIGSDILEKSKSLGWGAQVISDGTDEFGQVPLDQISWYHHISQLAKVKDDGRVIGESVMDIIIDKLPISDAMAEKLSDIYLYVESKPHSTSERIAESAGIGRESVKKYLRQLSDIGLLMPEGKNKNRTYRVC